MKITAACLASLLVAGGLGWMVHLWLKHPEGHYATEDQKSRLYFDGSGAVTAQDYYSELWEASGTYRVDWRGRLLLNLDPAAGENELLFSVDRGRLLHWRGQGARTPPFVSPDVRTDLMVYTRDITK